jgi:hypothetical protein
MQVNFQLVPFMLLTKLSHFSWRWGFAVIVVHLIQVWLPMKLMFKSAYFLSIRDNIRHVKVCGSWRLENILNPLHGEILPTVYGAQ